VRPRRSLTPLIAVPAVLVVLVLGVWLGGHPSNLPGPVRDVLVGDEQGQTYDEAIDTISDNYYRKVSRDQLLVHTRNREWEPFDRSIDIRIGRLRRKVEPDPAGEPRCIRTVRNAGYMYVPDA